MDGRILRGNETFFLVVRMQSAPTLFLLLTAAIMALVLVQKHENFGVFNSDQICLGKTCLTEADFQRLAKRPVVQVVHRRPIFGVGNMVNDVVFQKSKGAQRMYPQHVYSPFGYGVPAVQPGAKRRFRLYAVYTDTITSGEGPSVELRLGWEEDKGKVVFKFPLTWGGAAESRDAYSNEIDDSDAIKHHARLYTWVAGNNEVYWRFQYIEVQTLDVWE